MCTRVNTIPSFVPSSGSSLLLLSKFLWSEQHVMWKFLENILRICIQIIDPSKTLICVLDSKLFNHHLFRTRANIVSINIKNKLRRGKKIKQIIKNKNKIKNNSTESIFIFSIQRICSFSFCRIIFYLFVCSL